MKKLFYILFLLCLTLESQASFLASNYSKIDPEKPTHILIAGYPEKLGELFVYSLLTKAKFYLEKSKDEQLIIIARNEDKDLIINSGFKILKTQSGLLKTNHIKEAQKSINHISSIDIFAHSNALSGATLDTNTWIYQFLNEKDDLWDDVAKKINHESFIFIHGCNAGIKFAPLLAKKLNIAIFAALTSTDFQSLYNEDYWSFDYNSKNALAKKNLLNYNSPKSCGNYCTRMKPDNSSYKGHWGNWSAGGYPTYKVFCGTNDNVNCEKGALEGLFSFPSLFTFHESKKSLQNFKNLLIDFMCPFSYNQEKQNDCRDKLEESYALDTSSPYSPFKGKTLTCDRIKCEAHFICPSINAAFNPSACYLENDSEVTATTFTDEYKYFINLFKKYYE